MTCKCSSSSRQHLRQRGGEAVHWLSAFNGQDSWLMSAKEKKQRSTQQTLRTGATHEGVEGLQTQSPEPAHIPHSHSKLLCAVVLACGSRVRCGRLSQPGLAQLPAGCRLKSWGSKATGGAFPLFVWHLAAASKQRVCSRGGNESSRVQAAHQHGSQHSSRCWA